MARRRKCAVMLMAVRGAEDREASPTAGRRQLVAAGLLHRYGWTGHDPGRGFDAASARCWIS